MTSAMPMNRMCWLSISPLNVTLDKQAGGMVFTSGPLPEGFDAKTGAVFYYGKKLKLPLEH